MVVGWLLQGRTKAVVPHGMASKKVDIVAAPDSA